MSREPTVELVSTHATGLLERTSRRTEPVVKFRIIPLLALYGTSGFAAETPSCADSVTLIARSGDSAELRRLLRQSSLATVPADGCRSYRARLDRSESDGWVLTVTDTSTAARRQRRVSRIAHAATWLEAWLQSGFGPLDEASSFPAEPPRTGVNRAPALAVAVPPRNAERAIAAGQPRTVELPGQRYAGLPLQLGAGPVLAMTEKRYGFVGGVIELVAGARRAPQVGFNSGVVTQFAGGDVTYRRHYWAGPQLGLPLRLADHVDFVPQGTLGLAGTSAKTEVTATAIGTYFGLAGALRWSLMRSFDLTFGLDARVILPKLLGSSAEVEESDDDEEVTTSVVPEPSTGSLWLGLRLTLAWHTGGLT